MRRPRWSLATCRRWSRGSPPCRPPPTNAKGTRPGDPVNLVVIGEFEILLGAFAARWDESETITLATCWKTMRSFLLGSQYRYSPVSALHLFGRSQDIALQRTRRSINERLHLRLWLTPLAVSRTSRCGSARSAATSASASPPKTWNLTTHRVDPDVDEARDYVIEDLLQAERIEAAGYVDGVGACEPRQAAPQPDRRSLFHRRQAGRRDAIQLAHEAEICRLGVRRSSCQLTRAA